MRIVVISCICAAFVPMSGFERDAITLATAPYRFSMPGWELSHLPDKWMRRWLGNQSALARGGPERQVEAVHEFFAASQSLRRIDQQLLEMQSLGPSPTGFGANAASLREERARLQDRRDHLQSAVEETVETAVSDALVSLGFRAWTGPFPPVDTILSASPTILVTSPRDRIERRDTVTMIAGLTNEQRDQVESWVERETDLSAIVLNTGGIALYPSIVVPYAGIDFALEVVAHEWVHQWLWFRPLGRRYFAGGDITSMNETVADIAGREIGELARELLDRHAPPSPAADSQMRAKSHHHAANDDTHFDFQEEMRTTRLRVDELLAAGEVERAEAYMEERRRGFVAHGYRLRKLNQAYFAFHGTYATTGAAGVSVIGQQTEELRRRSPNLGDFLRTVAQFTSVADLEAYLEATVP